MLSWLVGPPLPTAGDAVKQTDFFREVMTSIHRQEIRASSASALRARIRSRAPLSVRTLQRGLRRLEPLCTPQRHELVEAVDRLARQRRSSTSEADADDGGEDDGGIWLTGPEASAVDVEQTVFLSVNAVAECDAVQGDAERTLAQLEGTLQELTSRVAGPRLDRAISAHGKAYKCSPEVPVADFHRLPLGAPEILDDLLDLLAERPFIRVLDLSSTFIPAEFASGKLLDAVGALQQLSVLSIAGNTLPVAVLDQLVAHLADSARYCPSLTLVVAHGNDFTTESLSKLDGVLRARCAWRAANGVAVTSIARFGAGLLPPGEGQRWSALSLDGGGMRAVAQLEFLKVRQLRMPRKGTHVGEAFDAVFACGWSAVLACAVALRRPLSDVDAFFRRVAIQVLVDASHVMYYAEAAGRGLRQWWSNGSYYSAVALDDALQDLFGDARFDFATTNVVIPLEALPVGSPIAESGHLVLASAWPLDCPTLRHMDVVDHDQPAPLIRDVLRCALATPSMFAASPLRASNARAKDGVAADSAKLVYRDAIGLCPNPTQLAICAAPIHHGILSHITSVACSPEDRHQSTTQQGSNAESGTAETVCVMSALLRSFPRERDWVLDRLETVSPRIAAAVNVSSEFLGGAPRSTPVPGRRAMPTIDEEDDLHLGHLPSGLLLVDRVRPLVPGAPGSVLRLNESDSDALSRAREAANDVCSAVPEGLCPSEPTLFATPRDLDQPLRSARGQEIAIEVREEMEATSCDQSASMFGSPNGGTTFDAVPAGSPAAVEDDDDAPFAASAGD